MKLSIHKEVATRVPVSGIKRLFDLVCDEEAEPGWESRVNVVFTNDKRLRDLNRQFRSKDATTDVLSFNVDEPEDADGVFGELYISVPFATRQAKGYGGTLREELIRLVCHGLLHLFGYDHEKPKDARRMEQRQEALLDVVTGKVQS